MRPVTAEIERGRRALAELEASFRGRLLSSGDPDYHEYRAVWSGPIDRFPAIVIDPGPMTGIRVDPARRGIGAGKAR